MENKGYPSMRKESIEVCSQNLQILRSWPADCTY